ncbi:MAG: hypothetical protein ABI912_10090 [Actinomycetota bacterium]
MKLPIPSLGAAAGGVRELSETVAGLPGATARAAALVPRIEALVGKIERIADGAEKALARAEDAIEQVDAAATRAGVTIDHIDAAGVQAEAALARVDALLAQTADLGPTAQKLLPAVRRIADTVSETEVDAVVGLIDELPAMLDRLRRDILPLLDQLGPDVHATMEIVDDVRHIINGLPGAKLFRRRGEESEEEDQEEAAAT